ncbi:MAG: DUF975 family protein [Chitinivibrionales bacterium]|nr:DUF975 family protein [Chitinivibrionales bacterium]
MLTSNMDLMTSARAALKGKMGTPMAVFVVFFVITAALSGIPKVGWLINALICGPLSLGLNIAFLAVARGGEMRFKQLFEGFNSFGNALAAYIVMTIFIILWTLLLIVPGIIAALGYSQTFFIMADNRNIDGLTALRKSKEMMRGYKTKLFYLCCRFIGWFLLGIITLGVGFLWIAPYFLASMAKFYDDVKAAQPQV